MTLIASPWTGKYRTNTICIFEKSNFRGLGHCFGGGEWDEPINARSIDFDGDNVVLTFPVDSDDDENAEQQRTETLTSSVSDLDSEDRDFVNIAFE